jgi:hypothetical protein
MNYLIHATPIHPSLCLQYFILLFTIATITAFILLLLLLFHYYHHYKTVATDKPLRTSLFPGAAKLTTHLFRLINILWLPLCRINKYGFYFPRRLLRSPMLVGHQGVGRGKLDGDKVFGFQKGSRAPESGEVGDCRAMEDRWRRWIEQRGAVRQDGSHRP